MDDAPHLDQSWTVGRREAVSIVLTAAADAANPAARTLAGRLSRRPGGDPLVADIAVTAGGTAGAYTLTVALTSTHTDRVPGRYRLEVWDSVAEQRMAAGDLLIGPTIPATA